MPRRVETHVLPILAAITAALASEVAIAQDNLDADTREVLAYSLTEAALNQYTQATRNLQALPDGMPGSCDEDSGDMSLREAVSTLDAMPGAAAAIKSAGMTTREYVVFSWSLVQNAFAAWAVGQPGGSLPPGASQANVDFVNGHEAALQQLNDLQDSDSCDDEEYEEEDLGEEESEQ